MSDAEEPEPLATFEAAFLSDWIWEVHEVEGRDVEVVTGTNVDGEPEIEETTIYRGRVKSPHTRGGWEYGTFSSAELRTAGAFRTDADTGEWP